MNCFNIRKYTQNNSHKLLKKQQSLDDKYINFFSNCRMCLKVCYCNKFKKITFFKSVWMCCSCTNRINYIYYLYSIINLKSNLEKKIVNGSFYCSCDHEVVLSTITTTYVVS